VFGRSGLGIKHGLTPSNAVGVIDSDYRGEIMVGLSNHSDADYTIQPGERIAQLVIVPVFTPEIEEADELSETERSGGGFGSTGKE
jgi:dUTP pyrophosphatase